MADAAKMAEMVGQPGVIHGQAFEIMPIPMMEQFAEWFDAGTVSFAVEARALDDAQGVINAGGGTIHVFSADRTREWVRFDCFDDDAHYHYLNAALKRNVVWGYDTASNGPMAQWALASIRDRLPELLRSAGADEAAGVVEREGFDTAVLEQVEVALADAHQRSLNDSSMAEAGREWFAQWMKKTFGD